MKHHIFCIAISKWWFLDFYLEIEHKTFAVFLIIFGNFAECKHRVKRHDKKSEPSVVKNKVDKVLELVKEDKILEFIKRSDKNDKSKDQHDVEKDKSSNKDSDDSPKVKIKSFIRFYITIFV